MASDAGRTYASPWQGKLVLACRKCQRKLKGDAHLKALANLKKTVKQANRQRGGDQLQILNVKCMDLCPKNAVTVCVPEEGTNRLRLLRTDADIDTLYG
jgi:predicted metal-binding protein